MTNDNTLRLDPRQPGAHLRMMQTPDLWPHRVLPVKRPTDESGGPELGVMIAHADARRSAVYLTNLFDRRLAGHLDEIERRDYPSLEAVVADGWVVD